jgi:Cellulase (glycosyl hydrolase family 5)
MFRCRMSAVVICLFGALRLAAVPVLAFQPVPIRGSATVVVESVPDKSSLASEIAPGGSAKAGNDEPPPMQLEMKPDGTFTLYYHQVSLVSTGFYFWEDNWKWAEPSSTLFEAEKGELGFVLQVPKLGTQARGKIENPSPNVLVYDLTLKKSFSRSGVIGGGLEFALDLKSPLFEGRPAPEPTLLADNSGWEWVLKNGQRMKVTFSPSIAKVYFERNNRGRIRTFLLSDKIEAGTSPLKMTVTFPEGTGHKLSMAEEYGPVDTARWLRNVFPCPHSPVDLSTLNHQPGTHGFLRAVGDRLEFEDGTPARFWGINVMAYALFSSNQQIALHARRLAMLGFNLVRLHHHDSTRWVVPTVIDKHTASSRQLDRDGIDRVDYWIKCLRDNGIYVWLDMHSYREFRPGDRSTELGEVLTFDDISRAENLHEAKGFCQYDPGLQNLMVEFQEKYLSHVNRYTGLAYKDDPAVAFVLITNENDITCHFGVRAIPAFNNVALSRLFNERTRAFAEKYSFDEHRLQQPWGPGPPKIFLNDQEHAFYSTMTGSLRRLRTHALVAPGNMWGGNSLASIPALTMGDVIDCHEYDGPGLLTSDPRYRPNIISRIGIHQVSAKPLTVSEWNMVDRQLSVDRFAAPIYVASIAALQGWDAMMMYGYAQQALANQVGLTSVWESVNDPALLATMPAAAILFRNGHVSLAKKEYCLTLSPEQLFADSIGPETCAAARTLIEQSRFTLGMPAVRELSWLKPTTPPKTAVIVKNPNESFLGADARKVQSDTGEITRDWIMGLQTIDTPKSQIVQGAVDSGEVRLSNVSANVQTKHATVAVTAMDEQPIASSRQILVTTVARVNKPKRAGSEMPDMSTYSEPVRGTITIEAGPGLEAVALTSTGQTRALSDVTYKNGRYTIPLRKTLSHWYLLRERRSP